MSGNGASLDLMMAWAILRPMPGKMAMLRATCLELGWAMWVPFTVWEIGGREVLMFPGYLFTRPPAGQRKAMHELPFCAGPLEIVIFDNLRAEIDAEEARRRKEMQGVAKKSRLPKEQIVCKGFEGLRDILDAKRAATIVDTEPKMANHIRQRQRDSVFFAATLRAYESTDDHADAAGFSAEAMSRRRLYYQ